MYLVYTCGNHTLEIAMTWQEKLNKALSIGVSLRGLEYEVIISKEEAERLVKYLIEEKKVLPDLVVSYFPDRYATVNVEEAVHYA